ncbi:MAG: hypothetical protein J0L84_09985 [Verrucomicrobia bacterium]|nr:hypothetical protein [Verrucomicrobiota bacterium]
MWIASKIGFFSLVVKDGHLHVRGRLKRDMENLATLLEVPHQEIERWPQADYRWRIRLDPSKASHVLAALGATVDYPNFKSAIAATPDQAEKLRAYHDLWHGLFELQDRPGASTAEARPARR